MTLSLSTTVLARYTKYNYSDYKRIVYYDTTSKDISYQIRGIYQICALVVK